MNFHFCAFHNLTEGLHVDTHIHYTRIVHECELKQFLLSLSRSNTQAPSFP